MRLNDSGKGPAQSAGREALYAVARHGGGSLQLHMAVRCLCVMPQMVAILAAAIRVTSGAPKSRGGRDGREDLLLSANSRLRRSQRPSYSITSSAARSDHAPWRS
jgi:hypothetical protein